MEKKMKISDMIASAKYYWGAQANQSTNTEYKYRREVTKEDKINFQEAIIKGSTLESGEIIPDTTIYYNPNTKEVIPAHPSKWIKFEYGSGYLDVLTIFKTTAIGFVSAGASILLGYPIVTLGKGALIGAAIGAIKAYVDSVEWEETPMSVTKEPELIKLVRQPNGERFPEPDANIEHTS